ncbi:MAG TPA: hypothetical protein VF461_13960 [Gemmatimonadaceae bacterium]
MAGPKLDGAGTEKMKTLDEALIQLHRIHGLVETYALAIKRAQPPQTYLMPLRRALPTLASLLKGQFGMISDQAMALNMGVSRGSNEQVRVRTLREGIGSLRQAIDVAIVRVKENHAEEKEEKSTRGAAAD